MIWNWEQPDWPHFHYDATVLEPLEAQFLQRAGFSLGTLQHLNAPDIEHLKIALLSGEALKTSEIEGEILDRASVQYSVQQALGLTQDHRTVRPEEQGISEMVVDLHRHWGPPLTDEQLFKWHTLLHRGLRDASQIGAYRSTGDPMQIMSGPIGRRKVHFEAPPADRVDAEMQQFMTWLHTTTADGASPLPALTRAGLAHTYFLSIHPFHDGNGRIARAISEKVLAQSLDQPSLIALADVIGKHRKAYYAALEKTNHSNRVTDWLVFFANTILEAQQVTQERINFILQKTKFYDQFGGQLNTRQEKALARMFQEGPEGFLGGMSAEKYIKITGTSRATATRDLAELVIAGAFTRTGERKHTRYHLHLPASKSI